MRNGSSVCGRRLIQRKIQRRTMHVKFCITRPNLAGLNAKEFLVEFDALLNVLYVKREMRLQCSHFWRRFAFHLQPPLMFIFALANVMAYYTSVATHLSRRMYGSRAASSTSQAI